MLLKEFQVYPTHHTITYGGSSGEYKHLPFKHVIHGEIQKKIGKNQAFVVFVELDTFSQWTRENVNVEGTVQDG